MVPLCTIFQKIKLKRDGTEEKLLYDGDLGAESLNKYISLGIYEKGYDGEFIFTIEVPKELKNAYALSKIDVKWVFAVEKEGNKPQDKPSQDNPNSNNQSESNSDQDNSNKTNTSSNQITGCTRGANSTVAATHTDNTAVYNYNSITYGADDILEASYRNTQQDPVVDFPLTKISRSGYSALSSKFSEGTPTQYYVQRLIDKITITLYLTPGSDQVNNVMFYYYAKRIQDVGAYTNITDVPYRFVPCMCAGLAYYLAVKFAPQRGQEMKLLYEDELTRALEQDGSPSSSFITPKTYYPNA